MFILSGGAAAHSVFCPCTTPPFRKRPQGALRNLQRLPRHSATIAKRRNHSTWRKGIIQWKIRLHIRISTIVLRIFYTIFRNTLAQIKKTNWSWWRRLHEKCMWWTKEVDFVTHQGPQVNQLILQRRRSAQSSCSSVSKRVKPLWRKVAKVSDNWLFSRSRF